ncbi:hypothetical protein ABKA04_002049 [Annulohypoxylon sp. FPYF3050]
MEILSEDKIRQTINNDGDSGAKEADEKPSPDINPPENEGNLALSEELYQMQKRLAEIDQQTQTNPEGLIRANLIESIFKKRDVSDFPLPPHLLPGAFPSYLGLPAYHEQQSLEVARARLTNLLMTSNSNLDPVQRYLQIESARLEVKHRQEKLVVLLTERAAGLQRPTIPGFGGPPPPPSGPPGLSSNDKFNVDDSHTEPIVLCLDWENFRLRDYDTSPDPPYGVIEVLNEEPILIDPYRGSRYVHERDLQLRFDNNDSELRDPAILGQMPLPERIRIRSKALYMIFKPVGEVTLLGKPHTIVMTRPFKFLSFYQNQLHVVSKKLNEIAEIKIRGEAPTPGSSSTEEVIEEASTSGDSGIEEITRNSVDMLHPFELLRNPPSFVFTHLRCLLEFMDTTIIQKQRNLREHCKKVSFVDLWHLFKPGDEVLELGDKYMQCYKIVNVTSPRHKVIPRYFYPYFRGNEKGGPTVSIHCVYVDFDGSVLGPVLKRFDISRYNGLRDITSLPVYPLSHAKNSHSIRQTLIDRGNKFLKVLNVGHMHYNGLTLESRDEVDSQVVIDFTEAFAHREDLKNVDWKPKVQSELIPESDQNHDHESIASGTSNSGLDGGGKAGANDNEKCTADCCTGDYVLDDNFVDQKQNEQFLSNLLSDTDDEGNFASLAVIAQSLRQDKIESITDDDKVIMTYRVFGFILRSRSWAKLNIQELVDLEEYRRRKEKDSPAEQEENAFDNLVFPNDGLDRKTIIRSLVTQHFRDRESRSTRDEQSDIIRGKGKGLIILLHGAPGVGKTTTAEGIAELFNRPLFQITCGDLGTTAREVENVLETNFALANKWGSILLLDEADVFLARRTPQDFKRNGLVAVFLRVLEYYAGILFLTTNRIGDFDEAFSSRIHISLHYPALDYNSTIEIFELNWRLMRARFAHKNRTLDIDTGKITGYVADYWHNQKDARWNGRQIRNACQTALALAEFEAHGANMDHSRDSEVTVHLGVSHMETVANAYLEFIKYLQDVRDVDQERYGWLMGIRRREGRGIAPEDPLAYNSSAPFRGGYTSSLAEQRARLAQRHNRQEPTPYQQGYSTPYTPERQSHRYGASLGTPSPSLYQPYSEQSQRGGPYQPPSEPQVQQGWNPRTSGGFYAGPQDAQRQQSPMPGQEAFPLRGQYGQHTQE